MTTFPPTQNHGDIATAINERNEVVGEPVVFGGRVEAWLSDAGQTRRLGTLGGEASSALDVDDRGRVVGRSRLPESPGQLTWVIGHAFIHEGEMKDLNHLIPAGSGLELVEARAINSAGEVCGYGRRTGSDFRFRAFLLTPVGGR